MEAITDASRAVILWWETDGDAKNNTLHVEKLAETVFLEIGVVLGTDQRSYTFTLEHVPAGVHVFRLRQSGPYGIFSYSDEISVRLVEEGLHVQRAFPNPFRSEVMLTFATGTAQRVAASLYDAAGRRVQVLFSREMSAHEVVTVRLAADRLQSGVYFVRFAADGRAVHTESILLVR